MPKHPTTIRLDPRLRQEVDREAKKAGLTFTTVVHLLLRAFIDGNVQIGVTALPKSYVERLEKEAEALRQLHRKGNAKTYTSSKKLFDDILDR